MWPIRILLLCGLFFWDASAFADGVLTNGASEGSGLPAGGSVADCVLNTAPGVGAWQACPGAAGGDSISVDGGAVVDPNFASTGDVDFVNTANTITGNINANSVALGTDTTGNYALGDAEGGAATTGDSATAFFSSGTIEDARLPSSMANKTMTGSLNIPNSISLPGTCTVGDEYMDTDAATGQRLYLCESTNTWALQGAGAPSDATYITQTAHANLSAEQALGSLGTGCMASTTTTGVVATRTITGTANEITVTNGDCSATPTLSLPATIDLGGKTSFEIPNAAAPTTDAFGEIAGDNNAWAASRGAVQFFDGTANTFLLGTLASDTPANGECPKWNTGGTITWETCAAGGSVATDTIFDVAGDLVYGTGSNTAVKLPIGTANQLLQTNAGATAPAWTSTVTGLTSVDFGSNPADEGRVRLSSNEKICWELNTPGTDKCLYLNGSDEFELNAPLNLTGTAGPTTMTEIAAPGAAGTANQHYLYFNSTNSSLESHENAGSLRTYLYSGGALGTPSSGVATNLTGTAASLTAGLATALAANPADCAANQFATTIAASGALTCAAITDADVPNTITASNYLPLAGGTLTGSLITDNLGIEFEDSDVNPGCAAGEYKIYADLSETKFKKCMNGSATDMDTTGGTPDFGTITGGTNTTAAMVVGTGGSLAVSGSGTIAATTAATLAANGGNCSAGSYPLGVGADGAVESCTALASESVTYTNKVYNAASTGNDLTIKQERVWDTAGCVNTTAGSVFNLPVSNPAVATCDTGANIQSAYMAFNADTDQAFEGRFKLQTGFTGSIDWIFDYKMASATTGAVGWCVQMVRVLPGTTAEDPAYPAQASGNCVSDTVPGTAGLQKEARITAATCTSCAAGDTVYFRVSRDANGGAVTDSATGNGELVMTGPAYAVVY